MRMPSFILAVLGALLFSAACRGATDPDDGLTDREARNLMPNFLAASWRAMEKHVADYAADADRASGSFSHIESCPQSGEIRIQGNVTVEAGQVSGTRNVRMEATKIPADCTYLEDGRTYVLSETVPLTVVGTASITANQAGDAQVSETGNFAWRIDNRSGICSVGLGATLDTGARTGLLTGTVCRRILNDSIAWPAAAGG